MLGIGRACNACIWLHRETQCWICAIWKRNLVSIWTSETFSFGHHFTGRFMRSNISNFRSEHAAVYLIASGADLNSKNIDDDTPLHFAISLSFSIQSTWIVRHLLINGADPTIWNRHQKLPIDLIADHKSTENTELADNLELILVTLLTLVTWKV